MIIKEPWQNIYQCGQCNNILPSEAFKDGRIYQPCRKCGHKNWIEKSGRKRFIEETVEKRYLFGLIVIPRKVKKFVDWEILNQD